MKKAISILLLFAVAATFVSCGSKEAAETTATSIVLHAERETVTAEQKPNESGIAASGNVESASWILYNDGALEITGTGTWNSNPELLANAEKITKVIFSEGISTIGQAAFAGCENLKEIILPESLLIIEAQAFSGCGIKALNIGRNVAFIAADAFDGCEITDIKISQDNAYYSTDRYGVIFNKAKTELIMFSDGFKMNSYTVPNTVEKIGEYAFLGNERLVAVDLPESLKEISARAFADCNNLKNINIPSQLTLIGASAFESCSSISEIEFSESVQIIGDNAFAGCTDLFEITVPKSVTTIGNGAFADTVEKVYYDGSENAWKAVWVGENAFVNASIIFNEK
ncbi:MAG: leucine-rich repeat domain-containing protein [Clostridia bacterium]|nr:leucine-rich repeat domain-containing protein [Clostridia bacterium]